MFYDQNIISVDIELFKLANVNSPAASDLSLTKRLVVTFNSSCDWDDQLARSFNTINLRNLFTRCGATFPNLQSIVVYTDGTMLPCTSLIDIFQDCHNSPSIFSTIDFCNVGQFVASTRSGITLTVKFKELTELGGRKSATCHQAPECDLCTVSGPTTTLSRTSPIKLS